jgi:hypothetical protein
VLLDECHPSIGVVCGSDNHIFVTIHTRDRLTRAAIGTIEDKSTQSD